MLTSCWVRLCLVLFHPFEVNSRLVCLADGIKAEIERIKPTLPWLGFCSAAFKPETALA